MIDTDGLCYHWSWPGPYYTSDSKNDPCPTDVKRWIKNSGYPPKPEAIFATCNISTPIISCPPAHGLSWWQNVLIVAALAFSVGLFLVLYCWGKKNFCTQSRAETLSPPSRTATMMSPTETTSGAVINHEQTPEQFSNTISEVVNRRSNWDVGSQLSNVADWNAPIASSEDDKPPVSYTHLTLPTNREV